MKSIYADDFEVAPNICDGTANRKQWGDELEAAERVGNESRVSLAHHCYSLLSRRAIDSEMAVLALNKNFRPCIADVNQFYLAELAAWSREERILRAGADFRSLREKIDAATATDRAERRADLALERWEKNMAARYAGKPVKRPRPRRTVLVDGVRTKIVREVRA
jgi:hypothetical protein